MQRLSRAAVKPNHARYSIHCNDRKQLNTTHRMSGLVAQLPDFCRTKRPVPVVGV
jgi:hypothetical protein